MNNKSLNIVVAFAVIAVVALMYIAVLLAVPIAVTTAFSALFGLISIAFTHLLSSRATLENLKKERLQDAQGLARALAAEIGIFGHHTLAKAFNPRWISGTNPENISVDPDVFLKLIELPSCAVFDANVNKIALLGVLEPFDTFAENEERLVERVVGYYEGLMDLRLIVSEAKLQGRDMTYEEVSEVQGVLKDRAQFALRLAERLRGFVKKSEESLQTSKTQFLPKSHENKDKINSATVDSKRIGRNER